MMQSSKTIKSEKPVRGLVIRGSRNLFTIRVSIDGTERDMECRIKGKVLKDAEGYYNPLAPGDTVEIEDRSIIGLEKRRNLFARFNQKGQKPQLLASNVDLVLCVTSVSSPPFRPRFLDRALLHADIAGIPAAIVCNKYDLAGDPSRSPVGDPDTEERLSDFERIGYPVFRISARTGEGLGDFERFITGKFSVLVGQSGVGKSSIVNALMPEMEMRTGLINEKFNRGNHTTSQGILLEKPAEGGSEKTRIVDTPGIRRFALTGLSQGGIPPKDLILYMREFAPLAGKCSYGLSCSHETEPGCKILEAVDAGVIHEDRWMSFLRIREELTNGYE